MYKKIESGIKYAYKNQSISMLEQFKYQAMRYGHYDLAEKAVKCINSLQNPLIFYNWGRENENEINI